MSTDDATDSPSPLDEVMDDIRQNSSSESRRLTVTAIVTSTTHSKTNNHPISSQP